MTTHSDDVDAVGLDGVVVTRWDAIPGETVRRGVFRRGFGTTQALLVMNEIATDIEVAPHSHDDFDQLAYIVSGRAIYHIGDIGHSVGPGSLLKIPAGLVHYIEPSGEEPVLNLDVFAPVRPDYLHLIDWMPGSAT